MYETPENDDRETSARRRKGLDYKWGPPRNRLSSVRLARRCRQGRAPENSKRWLIKPPPATGSGRVAPIFRLKHLPNFDVNPFFTSKFAKSEKWKIRLAKLRHFLERGVVCVSSFDWGF
jgi:hypothetical protein